MPSRTGRGTTARALTAVGIAVLLLAAAGGVTAYASTRGDTTAYRTATVTRQSVQQVLRTTGTIEPGQAAVVSFAVSGTVATVPAVMGDRVAAGQVLATLDTTALASAEAESVARVADAELTVHQAETGQTASGGSGSSAASASSGGSSGGSSGR